MKTCEDLRKRRCSLMKTLREIPLVRRCVPTCILMVILNDVLYLEEVESIEEVIRDLEVKVQANVKAIQHETEVRENQLNIVMSSFMDWCMENKINVGSNLNYTYIVRQFKYYKDYTTNNIYNRKCYVQKVWKFYYDEKKALTDGGRKKGAYKKKIMKLIEEYQRIYYDSSQDSRLHPWFPYLEKMAADLSYLRLGIKNWRNDIFEWF